MAEGKGRGPGGGRGLGPGFNSKRGRIYLIDCPRVREKMFSQSRTLGHEIFTNPPSPLSKPLIKPPILRLSPFFPHPYPSNPQIPNHAVPFDPHPFSVLPLGAVPFDPNPFCSPPPPPPPPTSGAVPFDRSPIFLYFVWVGGVERMPHLCLSLSKLSLSVITNSSMSRKTEGDRKSS